MDETVSTIRHTLVLRRLEPGRNVARFYALMIECDLFGRVVLVRHWSRIGGRGSRATTPICQPSRQEPLPYACVTASIPYTNRKESFGRCLITLNRPPPATPLLR